MQTLTKLVIQHQLAERVLTDGQVRRVAGGSDQRRHQLVNRAMVAGELVRLRRGRYVLANSLRRGPAHPYALAQAFHQGSYVSFESALAHHGWIPEAVHGVASVTPGRKTLTYRHETFGEFSFHPLALKPGGFLVLVERNVFSGQAALLASPVRALMDLVCLRKQEWQGMDWLVDGMRIDEAHLRTITGAQIRALLDAYSHKRVQNFLTCLARELGND